MLAFDSALFRTLATLALVIAVVAGLILARAVFVPIFIALFLALILHLPMAAMQRAGVPRVLAALVLTLTVTALFAVLVYFVSAPTERMIANYPEMIRELRQKLFSLQLSLREAQEVGEAISDVSEEVSRAMEDENVEEVVVREPNFLVRAASNFASIVTTTVITVTIAGFILAMRRPFLTLATIPARTMTGKLHAARIWRSVERQVSHYLLVTTLINIGLGFVVGVILWQLGVPMPIFWGAVVAFLNYMPFVGPAIGVCLLLAVSIVNFDTLWQMVLPAAAYMIVNFFEANFITPNLVGRRTNIAPLAIIVSLLVWGWMWGFAGLFISVPILVVLKATAERTRALSALHRMLSPRARH